jgi:hypothetical protein
VGKDARDADRAAHAAALEALQESLKGKEEVIRYYVDEYARANERLCLSQLAAAKYAFQLRKVKSGQELTEDEAVAADATLGKLARARKAADLATSEAQARSIELENLVKSLEAKVAALQARPPPQPAAATPAAVPAAGSSGATLSAADASKANTTTGAGAAAAAGSSPEGGGAVPLRRTGSRRKLPDARPKSMIKDTSSSSGASSTSTSTMAAAAAAGKDASASEANAASAGKREELLAVVQGRTVRSKTIQKGDKGVGMSLLFKEGVARTDPRRGCYIKSLQAGSPAHEAGFLSGDQVG